MLGAISYEGTNGILENTFNSSFSNLQKEIRWAEELCRAAGFPQSKRSTVLQKAITVEEVNSMNICFFVWIFQFYHPDTNRQLSNEFLLFFLCWVIPVP